MWQTRQFGKKKKKQRGNLRKCNKISQSKTKPNEKDQETRNKMIEIMASLEVFVNLSIWESWAIRIAQGSKYKNLNLYGEGSQNGEPQKLIEQLYN